MPDIYFDATQSFLSNLNNVYLLGDKAIVRDMETVELLCSNISILNPNYRCFFVNNRNDNIFAKVAETLWMLAGRDDIEWLSFYLPRAKDFSDNGKTWRGAYGPRLRNWNGADKMADQLVNVTTKLNLDPMTRQGVISLWDPSEDFQPTKDVPCNNWLHFFIRNGHLNMNVAQRSSDILWGYSGIDTFSWSVLMQMMAHWTNTKVGVFTHFISSLHLYDRHYKTAQTILDTNSGRGFAYKDYPLAVPEFVTPLQDLDNKLKWIFEMEYSARQEVDATLFEWIDATLMDPLLSTFAKMLVIYAYWMKGQEQGFYNMKDMGHMISTLPESDLRMAVIEYITRKSMMNMSGHYAHLTETELDILQYVYSRVG